MTEKADDKYEVNVKHVSGSTAGAGSGDFHQYRSARRIEQDRIRKLELEAQEEEKQKAFQVSSNSIIFCENNREV